MRSSFELAYFLFLIRRPYREQMISCGVEALERGCQGRHLCMLAGADHDETETLLSIFRKAALECGVTLPPPEHEEEWLAFRSVEPAFENAAKCSDEPTCVPKASWWFYLYLHCVLIEMQQWGGEEVSRFVKHARKFVNPHEDTGDYYLWLSDLSKHADAVRRSGASQLHVQLVEGFTSAVPDMSYYDIGGEHAEEARKLVKILSEAEPDKWR